MDTKRDDGGQAFPMIDVQIDGQAIGSAGMSMRDWFAGQALVAMPHIGEGSDLNFRAIAHDCYLMADAMLKARAE